MQSIENVGIPADWDALWRTVSESLLGGLHHALNNRVAALSAIAQVLGSGMPDSSPLVASLASEVDRLENTVALLSFLRRSRSRAPEPVQVPELVIGLTPLLAQHNDLKEIVFVGDPDPGVLPVWAERDLLTQIMLALMASVGLDAERTGRRRVRVRYRGDQSEVTIFVASEPEPSRSAEVDTTIARLDARAAASAVAGMKGTLRALKGAGDETAYEVRLPTLLAARRSENASGL